LSDARVVESDVTLELVVARYAPAAAARLARSSIPAVTLVALHCLTRKSDTTFVDLSLLFGAPGSAPEELRIAFDVGAVFGGHVIIEIDRGDRALGDARATVDAFIGVDEHLDPWEASAALTLGNLSQFVEGDGTHDAIARANVHACGVTRANALLSNDVGHAKSNSIDRASPKPLKACDCGKIMQRHIGG
jgi:hypothetical protein